MIYGYIRVSSDKQTVENQRFEINNFCTRERFDTPNFKPKIVLTKIGEQNTNITNNQSALFIILSLFYNNIYYIYFVHH